jgi:hypothetical protein
LRRDNVQYAAKSIAELLPRAAKTWPMLACKARATNGKERVNLTGVWKEQPRVKCPT